jgi:hypothetical protein
MRAVKIKAWIALVLLAVFSGSLWLWLTSNLSDQTAAITMGATTITMAALSLARER